MRGVASLALHVNVLTLKQKWDKDRDENSFFSQIESAENKSFMNDCNSMLTAGLAIGSVGLCD